MECYNPFNNGYIKNEIARFNHRCNKPFSTYEIKKLTLETNEN